MLYERLRTLGPLLISTLFLVVVVGSAPPAPAAPEPEPFPEYEAIRPNVEFWKMVWAEWSQGQVAVHDLDYPAIVYEVANLPGPIEERYSERQIDFVEQLLESWQKRLRRLSVKALSGASLSDAEKALVLDITTHAGTDALADAHERVRTQRGLRERFRRGLEISHRYDAEFREIFRQAGLPEDLAYLPHVESSFQAAARSSAGAVGIWQFTRGTGRRFLTVTAALDERLDPIAAARGAARYVAAAYAELDDWPLALTSYNHGLSGMLEAVAHHGRDYEAVYLEYEGRLFGFASRNFYAEFLAAREIARDPRPYFPEGFQPEPVFDHESFALEHRSTAARIAAAFDLPLDEVVALNPAWTSAAVRHGLALPGSTTVWLPAGTLERLARNGKTPDLTPLDGSDAVLTYRVRRGDTLSRIAWSHGMRLGELRDLNGFGPNQSMIRVGQKLQVFSPGDPTVYVVQRGDTLSGIAVRYSVRLADLLALNSLSLRSLIHPGQALRVPAQR